MRIYRSAMRYLPALALLVAANPVLAHHAMGGEMPATFWHGLLSGLAHPVIGIDHLVFILIAGVASALAPGGFRIATTFVLASLAGVLIHVLELGLPAAEVAVAASVLLGGLLLATGTTLRGGLWMAIMAVAGILHGYAFGEAVVGAQTAVIGAYLAGITVIGLAIAAGSMWSTRWLLGSLPHAPRGIRLGGAAASIVGAALLVAALVQD